MSSDSPLVYQLLDRDSIYDSIFDNLSPGNIFRVGRTSSFSRQAVRDYKSRAWDINKHLRRYFTDPIGFRALQAQTSAIISGSSAVQFLDRDFYPASDLDLYVDIKNAAAVCAWIEEHGGKGYSFIPTATQRESGRNTPKEILNNFIENMAANDNTEPFYWSEYERNALKSVLNFWSQANAGSRRVNIQVIVSNASPMASILGFHSSGLIQT